MFGPKLICYILPSPCCDKDCRQQDALCEHQYGMGFGYKAYLAQPTLAKLVRLG